MPVGSLSGIGRCLIRGCIAVGVAALGGTTVRLSTRDRASYPAIFLSPTSSVVLPYGARGRVRLIGAGARYPGDPRGARVPRLRDVPARRPFSIMDGDIGPEMRRSRSDRAWDRARPRLSPPE